MQACECVYEHTQAGTKWRFMEPERQDKENRSDLQSAIICEECESCRGREKHRLVPCPNEEPEIPQSGSDLPKTRLKGTNLII